MPDHLRGALNKEMRLNMGNRGGRWAVGSIASILLLTVMIACEHNAWADGSGGPASVTACAPPGAAGTPAPAAAATPVPPLSSPAMTGPLVMASTNEIQLPKKAPFRLSLPTPLAT